MNEININIEGYNVNGICVGCLNYNRRMFYNSAIKECFRLLANIDVPDGLEIQVCWECLARVKSAIKFRSQLLKSYDFLIKYSKEHTFLDSPHDFEPYASNSLFKTQVTIEQVKVPEGEEEEEKEALVKKEEQPLEYSFDVDIKEETLEDTYFEDIPVDNDGSSDEDVQLSKLKEETERDKKKKKSEKKKQKLEPKKKKQSKEKSGEKKNRKLKNLPGDLVELFTMTNEEMWVIRWDDLNSKEFQKLKYRCDTCIIAFNTKKLMQDHLNGKHQPKGESCHQCPICEAYFLTKDNLSAHKALHQQGYKCKECGFNTGLKKRMIKHVTEHKSGDSFTCSSCGGSFSTKSKLLYHRAVCRQEKPQCDCCGKVFANKMTLKYHLKILPRNKEEKPKEKLFIPCKGCDKIFHSKKSYRAHVVIHDGLSYPCPICGKLFQWKRNLYRHTRNHRERAAGALHECRDCGKTFASRDCYNNHMRLSKRHVADEALQHACTYCDKKFPTKWCLTDHVDWDHLKRIKYQCSSCFKAFKTAKILVAHVKNIHEGKKKEVEGEHLCEICGKSYRTVKRLKGHVWAMHTKRASSKVYRCKLCPATFVWQTSIYKHVKMMHDNKKAKTQRAAPPVKKEEPYPGVELANRMQYFQQNLSSNLNIVHLQPIEIGQNIVFK